MVELALIVAMAENNVIGKDNQLPWHLPGDLGYFKRNTLGKPVIMGRKTYESIGRPLSGRPNIVISRQPNWQAEGVTVCNSLGQAITHAEGLLEALSASEIMIMGGGDIYRQALPLAKRLYLTKVHAVVEGDAYFPIFEQQHWQQISEERHSSGGSNPYDYSFIVLDRM